MVALYGHVGIAIAETPTAAPYEGEYGMKKLITALVMVLAFAVSASAAVKEFETVKMDVPEGWVTQAQGPVTAAVAPDQSRGVTVIVAPAQGQDAKTIAETGAKAVNGTDLRAEGDGWMFNFDQTGQKGSMLVRVAKDQAMVITLIGEGPEVLNTAKSVEFK